LAVLRNDLIAYRRTFCKFRYTKYKNVTVREDTGGRNQTTNLFRQVEPPLNHHKPDRVPEATAGNPPAVLVVPAAAAHPDNQLRPPNPGQLPGDRQPQGAVRGQQQVFAIQCSLQGSVENLVKLENLQYLDLSYNLVREAARLSPLKKIHGLTVCVVGNRFLEIDGWKAILDGYRLTVEKQPRDLTNEKKQEPHPEPVQDKSPMNKFAQECPSPVVEYDLNFRQVGRRGGMRSGRPLATAAELIPNRLERGL
jgi:hypothetical protein